MIQQKLIFTRADGSEEECTFLMRGCVPGCVVVQFNPQQHDGLTIPLRQLKARIDQGPPKIGGTPGGRR